MRMRKKAHLEERMERQSALLIADPEAYRGKWRELLPGCGEVRLELGCGKGRFTVETARAEPGVLFVAVERVADAMVMAMERAEQAGLSNIRFIDADARGVADWFLPGEVGRVYLNFSDPWPSNRQAKRRLTHPDFLRLYAAVLPVGGQIHFKTDNVGLFEWSLFQFPKAGYTLSEVTRDLHANGVNGVMTDYEEKFYHEGKPIHRCVATKGETLSARLALVPAEGGVFRAVDGSGTAVGEVSIPADGGVFLRIEEPYRRRGYGTELLGLALAHCKEVLGMDRVLLTCYDDNAASARTILHYKAVLEDKIPDEDGRLVRRYKVEL